MPVEFGEPLSERELEIVALVAEGLTNREIAERAFLSPNTVKVHLRNIFTKTGVSSRTELSMKAVQESWITVSGSEVSEIPLAEVIPQADVAPESTIERWPWQRWLFVITAFILAVIVFALPQCQAQQVTNNPSDIFGASSTVYDLPAHQNAGEWVETSPINTRRAGVGTAIIRQQLFVVGGIGADGALAQVDRYDIPAEQWHTSIAMPKPRANIQVAVIDDTLYVPGGATSDFLPVDTLYSLQVDDTAWETLTPLPQSIYAYALAAYNNAIYLFGGWDGANYSTLSLKYDVSADTWTTISPSSIARGYGAAAVLNGKIYYVGGFDGQREYNNCEVYDPIADTWSLCAPLLQPRGGLGLAAVGAKLYAAGGGWDSNLGFSEQYAPDKDAWSIMETPLVGEWRNIGLTSSDTALYAVGGWDGRDFLNSTYTLEVLPWRVFIPGAVNEP